MTQDIVLAWAMPGSHIQLGPRLLAYAETAAAITTLRACVNNARSGAIGRLPPEIMEIVTATVREQAFEPRYKAWRKAQRCVEDNCSPLDHFSKAEINSIFFLTSYETEEDMGEALMMEEDNIERHAGAIDKHLSRIRYSKLLKANKV